MKEITVTIKKKSTGLDNSKGQKKTTVVMLKELRY